jgi:hypothetical protein
MRSLPSTTKQQGVGGDDEDAFFEKCAIGPHITFKQSPSSAPLLSTPVQLFHPFGICLQVTHPNKNKNTNTLQATHIHIHITNQQKKPRDKKETKKRQKRDKKETKKRQKRDKTFTIAWPTHRTATKCLSCVYYTHRMNALIAI